MKDTLYDNDYDNDNNSLALSPSRSDVSFDDNATCSTVPELSLTLTNSSISFTTASTSSFTRGRNYDRDSSYQSIPPLRILSDVTPSLLDIDHEENSDSLNSPVSLINGPLKTHSASFMEQTEYKLARISEIILESFCSKVEVSNCCLAEDRNDETGKTTYSDPITRSQLMDDFNDFLGNDLTSYSEENDNDFPELMSDGMGFVADFGDGNIRNRAGENWRARAHRIKQLRESRNLKDVSSAWNSKENEGICHSLSMDEDGHQVKIKQNSSELVHPYKKRASQLKPKQEVSAYKLGFIIGDCMEPILNFEGEEHEVEVVWEQQHNDFLFGEDLCYDSDPGQSSVCDFNTAQAKSTEQSTDTRDVSKNYLSDTLVEEELDGIKPPPTIRRVHSDSVLCLSYEHYTEDNEGNNERKPCLPGTYDDSHQAHYDEYHYNKIQVSSDDSYDDQSSDADGSFFGNGGSTRFYALQKNLSAWESSMIQNIQDVLNQTWNLIWHPTSDDFFHKLTKATSDNFVPPSVTLEKHHAKHASAKAMQPRCIQIWFERGNYIRRNIIVKPKLMWRDAYHPDLASKRKLNQSSMQVSHQVCLLDISRIVETTISIDRERYPLVKKSCSFLIRTCDDIEYVFEARSEELRDQILQKWKLAVARLASLAVVGDGEGIIGEFFVPKSYAVP